VPGIIAHYNVTDRFINEAGNKERLERQRAIDAYWKYYDGDHIHWLDVVPGKRDDNMVINLSGRAVDKMAEFVGTPKAIQLPSQTNAATGASAKPDSAQLQLNTWWETYAKLMPEIVQSGLVSGHTFLKLFLNSDEQAAFTLLEPGYVTVFWDALNTKQNLFYRMEWLQGNLRYRQDIVPDWLLEVPMGGVMTVAPVAQSWKIFDYRSWGQGWRLMAEQDWEHPFAPIVDWPFKKRAHSYYGVSMLSGGRAGLNDFVNFSASNIGRILKFHAQPDTFVFGAILDDKKSIGGYWDDLPVEARVETVELKSDLVSSMNFMNFLKSEFFSSTRVLDTSTVKDKLGQITNFGVRMLFDEMIESWEEITGLCGDGLGETFWRMLQVNGIETDAKPKAIWKDPLPTNRLEKLQEAQIEEALNTTSAKTIASDIGRNYEAEQAQRADEGQSNGRLLGSILQLGATRGTLA